MQAHTKKATKTRSAFYMLFTTRVRLVFVFYVQAQSRPTSKCSTALPGSGKCSTVLARRPECAPLHLNRPTVLHSTPTSSECSTALQQSDSAPQHPNVLRVLNSTPTVFTPIKTKQPPNPTDTPQCHPVFASRVPPRTIVSSQSAPSHHSLFTGCPTAP